MESDDVLIAAYRAGDAAAFERLYERYDRRLMGFLLSLGGRKSDADDLAQMTWMRALRSLEAYDARGRFKAWLFRIAHRLWLDHMRSAWVRKAEPLEQEDGDGVPIEHGAWLADDRMRLSLEQRDDAARLYAALDELSDALRQTVLLRLDAGMTYKEVAAAMDCPLGTALWRGKEAEKKLRERLGDLR